MRKCHFRRETANENKQFKETKPLISNAYLIRQIFAWMALGPLEITLTESLKHV